MCEPGAGAVPSPASDQRPGYKPRFLDKNATPPESSEEHFSKPKTKLWKYRPPAEPPTILDPDDPLMKRFQESLKSHLTRIDDKLQEEIFDLVGIWKSYFLLNKSLKKFIFESLISLFRRQRLKKRT